MLAPLLPPPVVRAAAVAAAATLGVLAGFGARDGTPFAVLAAAGLRLRGVPEFIAADAGDRWSALLGAAHAALLAFAWGALVARLAWRRRGGGATGVALAAGALLVLVDPRLPAALRLGAGAPSPAQRALCVATLVGAAALTARLAARPSPARPPA